MTKIHNNINIWTKLEPTEEGWEQWHMNVRRVDTDIKSLKITQSNGSFVGTISDSRIPRHVASLCADTIEKAQAEMIDKLYYLILQEKH